MKLAIVVIVAIYETAIAAGESTTPLKKDQQLISAAEKERLRIKAEREAHEALVKSLVSDPDKIPGLIRSKKIRLEEIPNPHWKADDCGSCHTNKGEASALNVRHKKVERNCSNCHHDDIDHSYIHPVNIVPSRSKKKTMSKVMQKELKKTAGKLSCSTCHDVVLQCRLEDRHRHENKKFFRAGPYSKRADLCMNCHRPGDYERFNPHEQIDARGKIIESKCVVCHAGQVRDYKNATSIDQVSFHIENNLNAICWGCHKWKPHPGGGFSFFKSKEGPNHLVKPSEYVLEHLEQSMKENDILLPLEPGTGKVFCATCHNPHAKSVIKNTAAAKGAESKSRLRAQKLCSYCHIK